MTTADRLPAVLAGGPGDGRAVEVSPIDPSRWPPTAPPFIEVDADGQAGYYRRTSPPHPRRGEPTVYAYDADYRAGLDVDAQPADLTAALELDDLEQWPTGESPY